MKRKFNQSFILAPLSTLLAAVLLIGGCQKQQEWLEIKADLNNITPQRIQEFQAVLDADNNFTSMGVLTLLSAAPFYLLDDEFNAITLGVLRNTYTWNNQIYEGPFNADWPANYGTISNANICLEGIAKIKVNAYNLKAYNQVKGMALFYRAYSHYNLMQAFAKTYDANTADTDLGVIVKLNSNINEKPERASIKKCYDQIIADLNEANKLLPNQSDLQIRPSTIAVNALLARIYLILENFTLAAQYATEALSNYSFLIDFNTLSATAAIPFAPLQNKNQEIIFYAEMGATSIYTSNGSIIDSTLYQSYHNNDLRKTIFYRLFNNRPIFKGFYTGRSTTPFGGIATNELFLIRAEALARLGNVIEAMQTLNNLLEKRWRRGTFIQMTANNADEALLRILTERRKELPFTGHTPWTDLRRLNKDPRYARTLRRIVGTTIHELPPNSSRYILPIPDEEIRLTGIPQNIRE